MERKDVIIAGGGIAGLTAAIHLARSGVSVALVEKHLYARHKVCGEYLSREVLPYMRSLGVDLRALSPKVLDTFSISSASGKTVRCKLPLGGLGISRFALDHFLMEQAARAGCELVQANITAIVQHDADTTVVTSSGDYRGEVVLGACGKRSQLDAKLHRAFFRERSSWLAFKTHYDVPFPDREVALFHFPSGYAGLSKTESGSVNFCCLARRGSWDGDAGSFVRSIVGANARLKEILAGARPLFDPLFISQVSFDRKPLVEKHVLMLGDMAGVIHPLCGNGMAMAVHSAKLASEDVLRFLDRKVSRKDMEAFYAARWHKEFSGRLWAGRQLASMLGHERITDVALSSLVHMPPVLRGIVRTTHGKPIAA